MENAFGILAAQWRIFHTKMEVNPPLVVDIIKASCVLHNMLQADSTPAQIRSLSTENVGRSITGLNDLRQVGNRDGTNTLTIHGKFKSFFSNTASLPWQEAHVTRGFFTAD